MHDTYVWLWNIAPITLGHLKTSSGRISTPSVVTTNGYKPDLPGPVFI